MTMSWRAESPFECYPTIRIRYLSLKHFDFYEAKVSQNLTTISVPGYVLLHSAVGL